MHYLTSHIIILCARRVRGLMAVCMHLIFYTRVVDYYIIVDISRHLRTMPTRLKPFK